MKKTLKSFLVVCIVLLACAVMLTGCDEENEPQVPDDTTNDTTNNDGSTDDKTDKPEQHIHALGEWTVTKEATCTEKGEKERVCSCGEKETEDTEAVGHTEAVDAAVAPTCTAEGKTEGKHCSVCNIVIVEQNSIPLVDHTYDNEDDEKCNLCDYARDISCKHTTTEVLQAVSPTCTASGLTEGKKCSKCGEILVAQKTVSKLGHKEVTDKAVAATCTTDGKTEGKHCSRCNVVLVAQTTVSAKGHTEVIDKAVDATCTTEGKSEGSHCSVCNQIIVKQVELPMKQHNYIDGYCDFCNAKKVSEGLQFENYDGYASVVGIGSCTDTVIVIPNKAPSGLLVKEIGMQAFQNCTNIEEVIVPDSVGVIGMEAFMNCTSLKKITLPSEYCDMHLRTFKNCTSLKEVSIPNNVFRIGVGCFENCTSLESVTIPTSVTHYSKDAFKGCTIKNIYISSIDAWVNSDFYNVESNPLSCAENLYLNQTLVTTVEINQNITFGAFREYEKLTKVVLGNSVTSIGKSAFYGCSGLTEVVFGNKLETIGAWAFSDCTKLNEIHLPTSLKTISDYAFYGCSSLQTITVVNGLQSLGDYAFGGCSSLRAIDLPSTITYMGISSFEKCASLERITIPFVGVATCSGQYEAFGSLFGSTQYEGGEMITQIEDSVGTQIFEYSYCIPIGLKHVKILKYDEYSSTRAFVNCKYIESVTFGKGVTRVGTTSIIGCTALTDIYYEGTKEEWKNLRYSEYFNSIETITITCSDGVLEKE